MTKAEQNTAWKALGRFQKLFTGFVHPEFHHNSSTA